MCTVANTARAGVYLLYNCGAGVVVGVVRTAIAVAYLIKHKYYLIGLDVVERRERSEVEEDDTWLGYIFYPVNYTYNEIRIDYRRNYFIPIQRQRIDMWKREAYRGLSEIFWVGAPIATYIDNFTGHDISVFGLGEIREKIAYERHVDTELSAQTPNYNPWY